MFAHQGSCNLHLHRNTLVLMRPKACSRFRQAVTVKRIATGWQGGLLGSGHSVLQVALQARKHLHNIPSPHTRKHYHNIHPLPLLAPFQRIQPAHIPLLGIDTRIS